MNTSGSFTVFPSLIISYRHVNHTRNILIYFTSLWSRLIGRFIEAYLLIVETCCPQFNCGQASKVSDLLLWNFQISGCEVFWCRKSQIHKISFPWLTKIFTTIMRQRWTLSQTWTRQRNNKRLTIQKDMNCCRHTMTLSVARIK